MHFDDPQDLEKVEWFQSRKQEIYKYFDKKFVDWWIGELMSRTRYITQYRFVKNGLLSNFKKRVNKQSSLLVSILCT